MNLDTLPQFIEASDIGMLRVDPANRQPGDWPNVYLRLDDVRELLARLTKPSDKAMGCTCGYVFRLAAEEVKNA